MQNQEYGQPIRSRAHSEPTSGVHNLASRFQDIFPFRRTQPENLNPFEQESVLSDPYDETGAQNPTDELITLNSKLLRDLITGHNSKAQERLRQITRNAVADCKNYEKNLLLDDIRSMLDSEMRQFEDALSKKLDTKLLVNKLDITSKKSDEIKPVVSSSKSAASEDEFDQAVLRHKKAIDFLLNSGKLKDIDSSALVLLEKTNSIARQYKLSPEQTKELLYSNLPYGRLRKIIQTSLDEDLESIYHRLQITNTSVDSVRANRKKLQTWRLMPGAQTGPSLDTLQTLLSIDRPDLASNPQRKKEFILCLLDKVEQSVFGSLRNQILTLIMEAQSFTQPLSYYLAKIIHLSEYAQSSDFQTSKPGRNFFSRALENDDSSQSTETDQQQFYAYSAEPYCSFHKTNTHSDQECRKLKQKGEQGSSWKTINREQLQNDNGLESLPFPKKIPLYSDSNKKRPSKEVEIFFKGRCYRCGRSNHMADKCLLYGSQPHSHTLCMICRRGFHVVCLAKKPAQTTNAESQSTHTNVQAVTPQSQTEVKTVHVQQPAQSMPYLMPYPPMMQYGVPLIQTQQKLPASSLLHHHSQLQPPPVAPVCRQTPSEPVKKDESFL